MQSVFSSERRVEFCETDAAGIAHFSSLIIYMEQAEHALLRSLGLSVASSHSTSWPRVKVVCEFFSPAKFEDVISVQTSVANLGSKSVTSSNFAGEKNSHTTFTLGQLVEWELATLSPSDRSSACSACSM